MANTSILAAFERMWQHVIAVVGNKADVEHSHDNASSATNGFMSASDKAKLDGIAAGANNYTYTLPAATSSALGGVKVGSNITNSSGTISLSKSNVTTALGYTPPQSDTNTTYTFATGDSNGQIKVTPSGGSAQNVSVKGLGSAAYTESTAYAKSSHKHSVADITSGTLSIARGGTGATSAGAALAKLDNGTGYNALQYLGLAVVSATGDSGTSVALTYGNMQQIPLTQLSGANKMYTSDGGVNSTSWYTLNADGSLEIESAGGYLVSAGAYMTLNTSGEAGELAAGVYVKKVNDIGDNETEIISAIDRGYGSGKTFAVSTGIKYVTLLSGEKLKLYGRMNSGSSGDIYAGNAATYLTIIRISG